MRNDSINGLVSTATAAGTTTLTVNSLPNQRFTGSTTQTIVMPVVTTLSVGWVTDIINDSTGTLTVNSSGGNLITTVVAGDRVTLNCVSIAADTTAAAWTVTKVSMSSGTSSTVELKSITASVGSNALTIATPASQTLSFRSATLSDGTINSRSVAAQSLVVPSGATLGTINATQSRLAVLAIDNAGTPELAVTNIAAGKNLDETTLINTNAIATTATGTGVIAVTTGILTISGSPTGTWQVGMAVKGTGVPAGTYITALGTGTGGSGTYYTNITTAVASTAMTGVAGMGIYSTTARSSLPFRVLGYVESTQATAGTWATTPSTVQGQSGQSIWTAVQKIINSAAVSTNGGSSYDFTGIPQNVKRITITFSAVSTNGASPLAVQLGAAGSIESSGYIGTAQAAGTVGVAASGFSSRFFFMLTGVDAAGIERFGTLTLTNLSGNVWVAVGAISGGNALITGWINGGKTLAGVLDRVRITTNNGTDLFDAGFANISWEF